MKLVAFAQRSHGAAQSPSASVLRWLVVALCLLGALPDAEGQSVTSPSPSTEPGVLIVFVRTGCPHCADAKAFLAEVATDRPVRRLASEAVASLLRPLETNHGHATSTF